MSILDVTEDQIFQTLGKGRDPNFKPIEKVRPVIVKPKKTYTFNNIKATQTVKTVQPQVQAVTQPVITVPLPEADDSVRKLTEDLNELNSRVTGLQKMVKWYIVPQFVVIVVLILAFVVKS
ncbi:MAG: hypothetical protein OIN85_03340 [Candidatus Methanoperedens sp.]|nr:hypothetical protein [Candidatus Methanoperedens sp.]